MDIPCKSTGNFIGNLLPTGGNKSDKQKGYPEHCLFGRGKPLPFFNELHVGLVLLLNPDTGIYRHYSLL